MNKTIERLFGIKLSKNGKMVINKWIEDEYGSLYLANKELKDDKSIMEFVNDMLKQDEITLDDITDRNDLTKTVKKAMNTSKKQIRYCPYCGGRIDKFL